MPELRVLQGGASNSRPTAKNGAAGLDTVRVRFRPADAALGVELWALNDGRTWSSHARGELRNVTDGVTVGHFPDGMRYVEGRAAAILHGEEDHRLVPAGEGGALVDRCRQLSGADPDATAALGRADLTAELHFERPRDGLALLRGAMGVDLPWLKVGVEGWKQARQEAPQTVYWRHVQGRSVVLRLYDKGAETGQAPPGMWIRMERQRRWRKNREQEVAEALADPRAAFVGRELGQFIAHGAVTLSVDRLGAADRVRKLALERKLTATTARGLLGYLMLPELDIPDRTRLRYEGRLRKLGIGLVGTAERHTHPVAAYVQQLASAFAEAA